MIKRLVIVGILASGLVQSANCESDKQKASKQLEACLVEVQQKDPKIYNQIEQKLTDLKQQVASVNENTDKAIVVRIFKNIIEVCWLITKTVAKITFVISATAILVGVLALLATYVPAGLAAFLGLCSFGWYSIAMHFFVKFCV